LANEVDNAWLAGILEGEGCFTCSFQNGSENPTPRIQLTMTDEDVVCKVATLLNTKVTSTDWRTKGDKAIYRTSLARKNDLLNTLTSIYPFMGQRRKAKIDELIKVIGGDNR
jgi:hypothetical protein